MFYYFCDILSSCDPDAAYFDCDNGDDYCIMAETGEIKIMTVIPGTLTK